MTLTPSFTAADGIPAPEYELEHEHGARPIEACTPAAQQRASLSLSAHSTGMALGSTGVTVPASLSRPAVTAAPTPFPHEARP